MRNEIKLNGAAKAMPLNGSIYMVLNNLGRVVINIGTRQSEFNMNILVIIYLVWGIGALLYKWFYSEIYQVFTPFLLIIPDIIILSLSAYAGIFSIGTLVKRVRSERFMSAIPLLIFLIITSLYFFTSFALPKVRLEYLLYTEKRDTIISEIKNGILKDDGIGNVELPDGYRNLSCDGEANIIENNNEGTVIGFWSFRGLLMNSYQMVIYTSYDEPPTTKILGCSKIFEIEKLGDHWYWITAY